MSKQVPTYINAPCSLFHGFADSTKKRVECINNALCYALAIEYKDCEDVEKSYKRLGLIAKGGNSMVSINKGLKLLNTELSNSFFSVSRYSLFDFMDNDKSVEECVLFLAYHALKSIMGNKRKYYFTTKTMMISRADGWDRSTVYDTIDISDIKTDLKYRHGIFSVSKSVLSEAVKSYSSRKRIDKLIKLLEQYYNVVFYTHVGFRGFYYSISLSKAELIEIVNEKKKGAIQ